jgi:O-antigen/teichoic acid export membrane protein
MNISKYLNGEKTFLRNILITILVGALVSFLNYLFNIYLARNFEEYNFGLYTAALGIIYLVQIPAAAIQTAVTKKVALKRDFDLDKFKIQSTLQLSIVALILSLLFILFGDIIANFVNIPSKYILPLGIALFGSIISPIPKGFLLGLEKIGTLNIVLLLETVLKFVMGYYAISNHLDITIPIISNILPSLLTFIFILPFVKTKGIKKPEKNINIEYRELILLFITFFLLNTPFTLDLLLVNPTVRPEYGALSLVGKIVFFASTMTASVMISKLANQEDEFRKKTILISLGVAATTGIAISAVYFLFTDIIVKIVFDGMYVGITPYIAIYGLAMTTYAVGYMLINSLLIKDSYIHILFLTILTLLQIIMFKTNNETLYDAVFNQLVIY